VLLADCLPHVDQALHWAALIALLCDSDLTEREAVSFLKDYFQQGTFSFNLSNSTHALRNLAKHCRSRTEWGKGLKALVRPDAGPDLWTTAGYEDLGDMLGRRNADTHRGAPSPESRRTEHRLRQKVAGLLSPYLSTAFGAKEPWLVESQSARSGVLGPATVSATGCPDKVLEVLLRVDERGACWLPSELPLEDLAKGGTATATYFLPGVGNLDKVEFAAT